MDLKEVGSGIVSVAGSFENKASLVVGVTEDLCGKYDAVALVKHGVTALDGKGGVADLIWLKLGDQMLRIYQEQSKE